MKVIGILLGPIHGQGISGGDRHALEIWNHWARKDDVDLTMLSCYWGAAITAKFGYSAIAVESIESSPSRVGAFRFGYIGRLLRIVSRLPRIPPADVIHASSPYFYDLIPAIALKRRRRDSVLIVSLFHLIPPPWSRSGNLLVNALAWIEQRIMIAAIRRWVDFVIVDNRELLDDLQAMGIPENRLLLSSMGARRSERRTSDPPAFDAVYVGRLSKRKGADDLLRVWRRVANAIPSAKLGLVGNEDGTFSVGGLVRELNLERNVAIMNGLTDQEVFERLCQSRCFITASREEGYGLSVLEALAANLPCVTFEIPAFAMAFPNGRLPARDLSNEALADAAIALLSDGTLYERLRSDASKGRVCSWGEVAEDLWHAVTR